MTHQFENNLKKISISMFDILHANLAHRFQQGLKGHQNLFGKLQHVSKNTHNFMLKMKKEGKLPTGFFKLEAKKLSPV